MSKPTDIPQDVWDEAVTCWTAMGFINDRLGQLPNLCIAILRERERCANIAINWHETQPPMTEPSKQYRLHDVADEIAHAIRNPSPAADPSRAANSSPAALDAASNSNFKRVQVIGSIE
jgi:hypothetical protein